MQLQSSPTINQLSVLGDIFFLAFLHKNAVSFAICQLQLHTIYDMNYSLAICVSICSIYNQMKMILLLEYIPLWLEMRNLNHLPFGMILNLDIGLLLPSRLPRHKISQKKWKRPKKIFEGRIKDQIEKNDFLFLFWS